MVLPLFSPYIQPGEIANLPTYNFYARLAAIHSQEPLSGETLLLDKASDATIADNVISTSRKHWANPSSASSTKNALLKTDKIEQVDPPTTEAVALPSKP
jgi:hypothetical protein